MSSLSGVTSSQETSSEARLIGRVKWFNNKAGYGFITVTDGDKSGMDVFVHHSSINVGSQQYKYLVQGEYIEFKIVRVENDTHECQASEVSGIKGGKLMCETRHDFKIARNNYRSSSDKKTGSDNEKTVSAKQDLQTDYEKLPETTDSESWNVVPKKSKASSSGAPNSGRGRGRPPRAKA